MSNLTTGGRQRLRSWSHTAAVGVFGLVSALVATEAFALGATVYDDEFYGGASLVITSDMSNIGAAWNDRISSIQVDPDTLVVLWEDSGFTGNYHLIHFDDDTLQEEGFNNNVTSVQILPLPERWIIAYEDDFFDTTTARRTFIPTGGENTDLNQISHCCDYWSDEITGIQLSPDTKVTLYIDETFAGGAIELTADTANIGVGFSDEITSLKIEPLDSGSCDLSEVITAIDNHDLNISTLLDSIQIETNLELDGISDAIANVEGKVDDVKVDTGNILIDTGDILARLQQKWPGDVTSLQMGHGCNGINDDGAGEIDDCAEDRVAPYVHIDAAVSQTWFDSAAAAAAAVGRAVVALDDCRDVTVSAPSVAGACAAVTATVSASDSCGNSRSTSTMVKVDGTAPSVTINPVIAGRCFATVAAAEVGVSGALTVTDNCSGSLDSRMESAVSECSLRVRVEATDDAGHRGSDVTTVRVDGQAPVLMIDPAVSQHWFSTVAEAQAAVARAVHVSDNCGQWTVTAPTLVGTCGNIVATVTATDSCGNTSTVSTVVKVDGEAPLLAIDPAVEGRCFVNIGDAEAAVDAGLVGSGDNCAPLSELDLRLDSTVNTCEMRVRTEAIDDAGLRSIAATTVRVDNRPPVVDIDRTRLGPGCAEGCFDTIVDATQAVLAATGFADECTAVADLDIDTVVVDDGQCGITVTTIGTDECDNSANDSIVVRVDGEAPTVTCEVATASLWPPDHRLVDVGFSYQVADNCPGDSTVELLVTSDENPEVATLVIEQLPPEEPKVVDSRQSYSDGELVSNLLDGSLLSLKLRAERRAGPPRSSNSGNGRVYRITVRATDPCGNVSSAECRVDVPVNFDGEGAVDDGQAFDPVREGCPIPGSFHPLPPSTEPLLVTAVPETSPGKPTAARTTWW